MLARDLVPVLRERGHEPVGLSRRELDVLDAEAVERVLERYRPEVVIQGAAYTAVDRAEEEPEEAYAVNAEGARRVAAGCQKIGASFVYPSTDYVFAGDGERPYTTGDPTSPVNAYGASKLGGETAALEVPGNLVVRTSWLYGAGGANFVETMLRLSAERDELQVVDDQIGRPTWTVTLSRAIVRLLERRAAGIVHVSDGGAETSWFGFALEIMGRAGRETRVLPVTSEAFPRPAARPRYSVLDCSETEALLGEPLPEWRASLQRYLEVRGAAPPRR